MKSQAPTLCASSSSTSQRRLLPLFLLLLLSFCFTQSHIARNETFPIRIKSKEPSEIEKELAQCIRVYSKFEEKFAAWQEQQHFHGLGLGKFETDIDDDDDIGLNFYSDDLSASQDEVPYFLVMCRCHIIETAPPKPACAAIASDLEEKGVASLKQLIGGAVVQSANKKVQSTLTTVGYDASSRKWFGLTSFGCLTKDDTLSFPQFPGLVAKVVTRSTVEADCALLEFDSSEVAEGSNIFPDQSGLVNGMKSVKDLKTANDLKVGDQVYRYSRDGKVIVDGEVHDIKYRGDDADGKSMYHFVLIQSKNANTPFCRDGDAGSVVLQLDKEGNTHVVGVVSRCMVDGVLKGSAVVARWKEVSSRCKLPFDSVSPQKQKDEL